MEGVTHILSGMVVQLLCFIFLPIPLAIIFTIILGFFSHFLIDTLAKITYHTPEAHKDDRFWVIWHICTPIILLVLIIWIILINMFWFFFLGGLCSLIVDIWDWGYIRPVQNKKKKLDPNSKWGVKYQIHPIIDKIRDGPFSWLPNWNHERKGIIPEIITILLLWILVILLLGMLP